MQVTYECFFLKHFFSYSHVCSRFQMVVDLAPWRSKTLCHTRSPPQLRPLSNPFQMLPPFSVFTHSYQLIFLVMSFPCSEPAKLTPALRTLFLSSALRCLPQFDPRTSVLPPFQFSLLHYPPYTTCVCSRLLLMPFLSISGVQL